MLLIRGEWQLSAINALSFLWLLSSIVSLSSILTAYSSFQSGQISDSKEIVFPKNYKDDDSHDTPPQVDEVADPLIKQPVFYLPTRDTVDS